MASIQFSNEFRMTPITPRDRSSGTAHNSDLKELPAAAPKRGLRLAIVVGGASLTLAWIGLILWLLGSLLGVWQLR